jgi:hypothetical protein
MSEALFDCRSPRYSNLREVACEDIEQFVKAASTQDLATMARVFDAHPDVIDKASESVIAHTVFSWCLNE